MTLVILGIVLALGPAASGAETPATVSYGIDPARSRIGFEMAATLHTVRGKTTAISGEFFLPVVPPPSPVPISGRITIASRTLDTGNASRDKRMRSESLDVETHPAIVFVPSRVTGDDVSLAPGSRFKCSLEGDLTIRGVTRAVTIAVIGSTTDREIVVDGSTALSFLDYGVPNPSNLLLRVDPRITVTIHIEARMRPPPG